THPLRIENSGQSIEIFNSQAVLKPFFTTFFSSLSRNFPRHPGDRLPTGRKKSREEDSFRLCGR
ncbi:MAG: hypothetical protein SOT90_00770, partial [Muribaculaceae bacterium]|nr:hypothetical protein [Muribaculaceae bacterium]